jgi:ferric-dicitrate binding protein FerR (iron transport regulator)
MDKSFQIAELIYRELSGDISQEELQELESWKNENPENLLVYKNARDSKKHLSKLDIYRLFNKKKVWDNLEKELFANKTITLFSNRMLKYAAAILLPLLIAGSVVFYFLNQESLQPDLANIDTVIQPGSQKAVLILSDGETVELGEDITISEKADKNAEIKNENNNLQYEENTEVKRKKKLIFNELKTPRGGGYTLTLSDGTQVWLNAGSSIKYPVSFSDSLRQVFLEGEGYFDVVPGDIPFVVTTNTMDVEVLGTSFNVSAYVDDVVTKTTLVEGKVRVNATSETGEGAISRDLTPNKQLIFNKENTQMEVVEVNPDHYTSWMRGKIEFNKENLDEVMRKLARWYDFEYRFDNDEIKELHFTASFDRNSNITNILEILGMTTNVKFEFTENTLVIL